MKKRILSLVMVMCMLCAFAPTVVSAATSGQCGDNVYWSLDDEGTLTISGTGDMENYNYNLHRSPFYSNSLIKNVITENGIVSIGDCTFFGCTSLASISIPNSVTSIGEYAFLDCTSLTSISIPDSVTSIGEYAFSDCTSLASISIPNSVTYISCC